MGIKARSAFAALGGAAVVTVGVIAFAGASNAVGPTPAPSVQAAQATCVTDANGFCTVAHSLGAVPAAIVVSANTPSVFNGFMLNTVLGSYTATSFQVRAMFTQTTPKANGQIWFTYSAYGVAATPPTTTTEPPITTTKTTVPPTTTPTSTTTSTTAMTPPGGGS